MTRFAAAIVGVVALVASFVGLVQFLSSATDVAACLERAKYELALCDQVQNWLLAVSVLGMVGASFVLGYLVATARHQT